MRPGTVLPALPIETRLRHCEDRLQGADDDAAHNRFSLGYLFDIRTVPERDLLVQDLIEERLEVLISFGPPAGIT